MSLPSSTAAAAPPVIPRHALLLMALITLVWGTNWSLFPVVVKEVPPGATVVGIPGRVVEEKKPRPEVDLEHAALPDPVAEAINNVLASQENLQECFAQLQRSMVTMASTVGAVKERPSSEVEEQRD